MSLKEGAVGDFWRNREEFFWTRLESESVAMLDLLFGGEPMLQIMSVRLPRVFYIELGCHSHVID